MTLATRWTLLALALLAAWAAGRYTAAPVRQSEQETVREEIAIRATVDTAAEEIAEHAASEATAARTEAVTERVRVVWRERIVQADGATEEREVEVDAESARLATELHASRQEVASLRLRLRSQEQTEALIEAARDLRREITAQPDWRLSAMVGLDIPSHAGDLPSYAAGVHIERRVLGPIHVGAWGLSSGAVGGSVGVAW